MLGTRGHGRPSALIITLTEAERSTLLGWLCLASTSARLAKRIECVLRRADGETISTIADGVGMMRRHVYTWLHRWQAAGMAGLGCTRGDEDA